MPYEDDYDKYHGDYLRSEGEKVLEEKRLASQGKEHPKDCLCRECIEDNARKHAEEQRTEANTIKELYKVRRNGRLSIWGTALGAYSAFWEWLLIKILWCKTWDLVGEKGGDILPDSNPYTFWHKPNGYSLIFYSLGIWVWWILVTVIAAILIGVAIVCGFAFLVFWTAMFLIVSIIYPVILIYSIILEFPASVLNRDFKKINGHQDSLDWHIHKGALIVTSIIIVVCVFVGLIVGHFVSTGWGITAGFMLAGVIAIGVLMAQ